MQSYKESLQLFQKNSMNLPMTEHDEKLNIMLEYLQHQLNKDKKDLQMLRQEIIHETYLQSAINEDTSTSFVEEMADFTRNFRKLADISNQETNELFKQTENLKNDKKGVKQTANLLDHRVAELEKVLGVGISEQQSQQANN